MIDSWFFHSTEFYVITAALAALIVGFLATPRLRGEARQFFATLDPVDDGADDEPSIEFECRDDGSVVVVRRGLRGVFTSGQVNLAITIIGYDVTIEERIVQGSSWDPEATTAIGSLDMLAHERYSVSYNSSATSTFATLTLNNRVGFRAFRPLSH